jgi:hypothetical protein
MNRALGAGLAAWAGALLSSLCCLLPLAVIVLGLGSGAFMAVTMRYRWILIPAGVLGIAAGFVLHARERRRCDALGCRMAGSQITLPHATIAAMGSLGWVIGLVSVGLAASPGWAGKADVLKVEARQADAERWTFLVTVQHDDQDPAHWADWWRVRTVEGAELGRRVLLHSHVGEQPFTRDGEVRIPRGVERVVVEVNDKVHGLGGKSVTVDLTRPAGPGYTVHRLR